PFADRLLVDPVALGQRSQALLTMLYRSTDRRCRRGAPMKNLAHSASFDSELKGAPSKLGIKHLGSIRAFPRSGRPAWRLLRRLGENASLALAISSLAIHLPSMRMAESRRWTM